MKAEVGKYLFAVACYLAGLSSLVAFFWLIEFRWDQHLVPFDWSSVLRNLLVFLLFPLQHSLLARPSAKRKIQQIVHPLLERSFYVGTSGLVMWFVLWMWIPFGPYLYRFESGILFNGPFYVALILILYSTVQLDHSAMFGLKQGYAAWKGVSMPPASLQTQGIYRFVRHPITTLLFVALWSHETLTAGRLLFNLLFSAYAVAGIFLEERDLRKIYGEAFVEYCRAVPPFLPRLRRR